MNKQTNKQAIVQTFKLIDRKVVIKQPVESHPYPFSPIKLSHHLAKGCCRPVSTILQRKGFDPDSPFKPDLFALVANLKLLSMYCDFERTMD